MKIYFVGVGDANHIALIIEHPACPRIGEDVQFSRADDDEEIWTVRAIQHMPYETEYDVYCIVGMPRRDL